MGMICLDRNRDVININHASNVPSTTAIVRDHSFSFDEKLKSVNHEQKC